MNTNRKTMCGALSLATVMAILIPAEMRAQQYYGVDTTATQERNGSEVGNYQTSFDFVVGYRFVGTNGNTSMYDTLVNLQQGPRILQQDLSMRSLNHDGYIFDRLNMSSFGYGGDPNTAIRIQMSKDKWYDFNMSYRHDLNVWDYNLLANPLNPVNPIVTINTSPHLMDTRRDMQDYNLTLFPESRFRFRAGYNYNRNQGPTETTFHEGTDVLLVQPFREFAQTYRLGADYKLFSKTTISYDQTFDTFRGDTTQVDQSQFFPLSNGSTVDIGLPYNPSASLPCKTPFQGSVYNPTCNGYYSYTRSGPVRSFFPTEQISLQSNQWKRISLAGRFAYSSGYSDVDNYNEQFNGLVSRTNERQFTFTGPAHVKRIIDDGDAQGTWQITEKLSFSDVFRFWNSRAPGDWNSVGTSCFPNGSSSLLSGIGVFNSPGVVPQICLGGSGLPQQSSNSPADIVLTLSDRYQNLNYKFNTATLEYIFNKRVGAHIGYRYGDRQAYTNNNMDVVDASTEYFYPANAQRGAPCTQTLADGTCVVQIPFANAQDYYNVTEQTGLFGAWVRPIDALRLSGEVELMYATGAGDVLFTRIEPRNLQRYKMRGRYTPKPWMVFSGSLSFLEYGNNGPDTDGTITANNHQHNRYAGFDISVTPRELVSFDVGYNWNSVFSSTNVCLNLGTPSTASDPCFADSNGSNTNAIWNYQNTVNTVYVNVILRPTKRLAFSAGYNLVDSTGSNPLFLPTSGATLAAPNPLQPLGSLASTYQRPTASIAFSVAKGWEAKGMWGYYDYHEPNYAGPVLPRNFTSNNGTVAVKYSF